MYRAIVYALVYLGSALMVYNIYLWLYPLCPDGQEAEDMGWK